MGSVALGGSFRKGHIISPQQVRAAQPTNHLVWIDTGNDRHAPNITPSHLAQGLTDGLVRISSEQVMDTNITNPEIEEGLFLQISNILRGQQADQLAPIVQKRQSMVAFFHENLGCMSDDIHFRQGQGGRLHHLRAKLS
jgi:hypothetical protein